MEELVAITSDAPPAEVAKWYEKVTGEGGKDQYRLRVKPANGYALEAVDGLRSALAKERESRETFERRVKAYGETTPESLTAMRAELESLKAAGGDRNKEVEARLEAEIKQREQKWLEEKSSLTKREKQLLTALRKSSLTQAARNALLTHAVDEGAVEVLLPHALGSLDLREEGEDFYPVVLDADGKTPRISRKQGNNNRMSIDEFVGDVMRSDKRYERLFKGKNGAGGGTQPGADGNAGGGPGEPIVLTAEQAKDPVKYRAARDRAIKEKRELKIG